MTDPGLTNYHYKIIQLKAQLENCQYENQQLHDKIETLEHEIADLTGELQSAEEELDMYEQMNEFGHHDPENCEK